VALLFDTLIAIEGARMVGEHDVGCLRVDDAHAFVAGDDGKTPLHVGVRHAVIVLVEEKG
jgi:hypothetical protein